MPGSIPDETFELCSSEILRALRGARSQVAFARRLGYRANPITDWENGRRFPTIAETVRAAGVAGVEVASAFGCLLPPGELEPSTLHTAEGVATWLRALQGSSSITDLASHAGLSRYSVGRALAGQTEPRLPDFLRLVDAATGRLHDWVHALVGIEQVPVLRARYAQVTAARQLALEHPWSEAVLRVLETRGYQRCRGRGSRYVARRLGIAPQEVEALEHALLEAGVVVRRGRRLRVASHLTVDTRSTPERIDRVRRHWAQVALDRLQRHRPPDWFAYNVVAVSAEDSERIEQRLRAAYREVRAMVAESEPAEVAGLLTIHMVRW